MLTHQSPQKSSLLISEPFMQDPNFKRSVILLTEYTDEGSVGYVLNHRSNLFLKDLLPDCNDAMHPVFIGGPVENDTLHFIHRAHDRMNSGIEICDGIYWGGNFEALVLLLNNKQIAEDEIRFFVGYSGWGESQLKTEIEQHSWLITNSYNPEILFINDEENLWREVVIALGPKYAHIANFPENPMWN